MIIPEDPEKEELQRQIDASLPIVRFPPPPYDPLLFSRVSSIGGDGFHNYIRPPSGDPRMVAVNGSYAGLGSDFTLPGVEEGESDVDRFGLGRSGFALTPSPAIGGTSSNRGQGSRAGLDDSQNNSFSNSQTRLTTLSEEEKEDHHGKEWRTFFDRGRKDRKGKGRVRFTGRGGNAVGTAGSAIAKSGREWDPRRWRRWSRKRWAVLIVILFLFTGGIIGGVFGGLSIGRAYRKVNKPAQSGPNGSLVVLPWQVSGGLTFDPIKDGPPAGDGKPTFCNAWSPLGHNDPMRSITFSPAGLNQSVATYFLPQNATSVFIHAEGDSSTGTIAMIGKEDLRLLDEADVPEGKIRVDVIMRYSSNATAALVCGMCKDDGSQGVGLYTKSYATKTADEVVAPDPNLSFVLLVRFPPPRNTSNSLEDSFNFFSNSSAKKNSSVSFVPHFNLTTDSMSLRIGDMHNVASFGNLTTKFGRGGISVEYVEAKSISLKTEASTISGLFNISDSLMLNTTNGGILAKVALHNPKLTFNPFEPTPDTTFKSLSDRNLWLADTPAYVPVESSADAYYDNPMAWLNNVSVQSVSVQATTTNGPLFLTYTSQDPGIYLDSLGSTTNGDAQIRMHPAFQGSFLVRSVNGDMQIPDANDFSSGTSSNVDPWELGRSRAIVFDSGSNETWAANLTSNLTPDSVLGDVRGNAVYDSENQSWNVQGITLWLSSDNVATNINHTLMAFESASQCLNKTCVGQNMTRMSVSRTITSWGGASLSFS